MRQLRLSPAADYENPEKSSTILDLASNLPRDERSSSAPRRGRRETLGQPTAICGGCRTKSGAGKAQLPVTRLKLKVEITWHPLHSPRSLIGNTFSAKQANPTRFTAAYMRTYTHKQWPQSMISRSPAQSTHHCDIAQYRAAIRPLVASNFAHVFRNTSRETFTRGAWC